MQVKHRANASNAGRPIGTDGSDFSYRMTVDQRFQKAANRKAQLHKLFIAQAACQLPQILWVACMILKGQEFNRVFLYSIALGIFSLVCGEKGRKGHSSFFLKLYMFTSSVATVLFLLYSGIVKSSDESTSATDTHEANPLLMSLDLFKKVAAVAGAVIQIVSVLLTDNLLTNMSLKSS